MSAATPEDIANVCKLLERLRTGEMNLIPSVTDVGARKEDAGTAMLKRVEDVLSDNLRRLLEPKSDGGAAFPEVPGADNGYEGRPGMTLRDYFAAKAMQAFVSRADIAQNLGAMEDDSYDKLIVRWAYETADAMLAARSALSKATGGAA